MRGRFHLTYEMLAQSNKATLAHEGALGMRIWFYDHGPKGVFAIVQPTAKAEKVARGNHCRFGTFERRDQWAQELLQGAKDRADRREAERAERAERKTTLSVDDIMVSSWGYEQTNVCFAQIIEIYPSGRAAKIRRLNTRCDRGNSSMSDYAVAIKDDFRENSEVERVILSGDRFKLKDQHASFSKWNGKPMYHSWYA